MSDHDLGELAPLPALLSCSRYAPDDPPPIEPSATLDLIKTETRHYRQDG